MIKHERLEKNAGLLLLFTLVIISIGGLIEVVPLFYIDGTIEEVKKEITEPKLDENLQPVFDEDGNPVMVTREVDAIRPYTPLEFLGRNIYVAEGCYNCHSQQIRPMQDEFNRYGHYSLAAESQFDKPFQWGSRRIGPDLARVGGKMDNQWHVDHLVDPKSRVPDSIMPRYPWLLERDLHYADLKEHMKAARIAGIPYSKTQEEYEANIERFGLEVANMLVIDLAIENLEAQAKEGNFDMNPERLTQMDAIVAYLQVLGTMVEFKEDQGVEFSEFR